VFDTLVVLFDQVLKRLALCGRSFLWGFQMKRSVIALLVVLTACGGGKDKPAAGAASAPPPPEVDVITVSRGSATLTQDLPGRLQAFRTAQVRARVEGIVDKRVFQEGSDVKAGQTLFHINPRVYQAVLESAKADFLIAQQTVARYQPLLAMKAVSQQEYDLAAAKVKQAQSALTRAQEDMENAHVPAAISGHIGRSLVTEGAFVGKGEATLLATIEQLDPIYANFTQSGGDLLRLQQAIKQGKLKRSDSASVELLLEDGSVYPTKGKLFFTDMAVDPSTGAVSVRAEFPNPNRELLPGMFVRIRFPQAVAENTVRVPQRAVQTGAQGQFVMMINAESKATPQPIKTSGMAGTDFVVADGLKGGEQIIVNGLQKARPGTVVKPVPLAAPASSVAPTTR
jgi:membrane fusion protein (multidrug efflux system)